MRPNLDKILSYAAENRPVGNTGILLLLSITPPPPMGISSHLRTSCHDLDSQQEKIRLGWGGESRNLQNNNAATGGRKGVRDVGEREERGVKIIVRHSPHSSCMLFCFLLPTMNRPVWMGGWGGECVRLLYNFPDQKCNSSKI